MSRNAETHIKKSLMVGVVGLEHIRSAIKTHWHWNFSFPSVSDEQKDSLTAELKISIRIVVYLNISPLSLTPLW